MLLYLSHELATIALAVDEELEWVNRLYTFDTGAAFLLPLASVKGAADARAPGCAIFGCSLTDSRTFDHGIY